MPTFDIVSEFDMHEATNAVNQASKEVETRFDFKGTDSSFELTENKIVMICRIDVSTTTNVQHYL